MTCHVEDHVHPIKVEKCPDGMSDVDAVVSDVLNDEAFRMANGMVSANSVNLARVLCFVPVFFHAYAQVRTKREEWGQPVIFSLPSSTFALEYAGHVARLMGLPITIVAACNANGAAHRVISLGELYKTDIVHTSSSALDVVVAENVWRSLYYAAGSNPLILSELQDDFDEDGEVALPAKMSKELGTVFKSAVVSDEEMYETIQREERLGYLPCPQTAIAIAALDAVDDVAVDVPRVVVAVSHPSKFPDVIRAAVPQLSNGASHPTVEAMHGLFHRRRTCSLEELERSLRRDIAALTSLRSPGPIAIERRRCSAAKSTRESISAPSSRRTKRSVGPRWTTLCSPSSSPSSSPSGPKRRRRRETPPPPPRDAPPKPPTPNVDDSPNSNVARQSTPESAQRETKKRPPRARHRRRRPPPTSSPARVPRLNARPLKRVRRTSRSRANHSAIFR